MAKVSASARLSGAAFARAVPSLYSTYAVPHLIVARNAALRAHEVEQANADASFGAWFDEMMQLVPVSVVMAAAALEANANELLQDVLEDKVRPGLSQGRKQLVKELRDARNRNAVDKFKQLAFLLDEYPNIGTKAWKNARLLANFGMNSCILDLHLTRTIFIEENWQRNLGRKYP